ncbi:hypothetical protein HN51_045762 [Arachis hypogaea]|uniref:Protein kinase domain-containing protein n=1 Tax=Arachis hypogaea TaxID=3818 RepID=A0A444XXQ1_ARAHY|nr:probable receptor-like serine/threonine-protein kinase At5g57670 [Arachis ipaensis]XP_025671015.1 probable receptor-like serine/threonine-protein kinase At5g57670 [Arachis hypogaea]QHO32461.1 Receptor-like cytosolic serine/threonine-protein kinase [Arachis hypogaea]RYQ94376.1 hypothetical protein Ahy_B08g089282 isoform A [Arachis hypogaea]
MKLIGVDNAASSTVDGGRKVLVGVKLDTRSRQLLTWALVKVAEPGDHVIALHVLDTITEGTSTLLSLVKTFNSVLAAYEGFCNLKQIDLKLKVCRGSSTKKVLVQEATSFGVETVILGTSATQHTIRSSVSVAKYCAKKLPKCVSVFAIDKNCKIAFSREASRAHCDQEKLHEDPLLLLKSLVAYGSNLKSCESCAAVLAPQEGSETNELMQGLPEDPEKDNSLALVPIQKVDDAPSPCYSIVVRGSNQSKPGWSFLRHVFHPRKHTSKSSLKSSIIFQRPLRHPSWHFSAVVHPDQKQASTTENNDQSSYALDGESGAIVPFGSSATFPIPSLCGDLSSVSLELLEGLREKYLSSCISYSLQHLASATASFSPENLVGRGGSSYVYRGHLPDGKELAVKILKPSVDVVKEFVQEIEILTTLDHKNIISLSGFCFEGNHLLLVYNFLSRGSLEENLHGNKKDSDAFGWKERFKVAVGVAEALDYLHNGCPQAVIHRDVKSSNILLSDDFEPQLSDFGLASWGTTSSHVASTDVAGTFGYLAPEYFMHGRVTDKIDVYAFGVVLLELLSNKKPIDNECPKGQESLVMWATRILKDGKLSHLLDPNLGCEYDHCQINRMVLAATLCIRRASRLRPQISLILKLLQGDEEVTKWAEQEVNTPVDPDGLYEESVPTNIQSHLNLALLDVEDDAVSISSTEPTVSLEDYLQGRWSRSSSFN